MQNEVLKFLSSGGRKVTVTVVVNVLLAVIAILEITVLKKSPDDLCYWALIGTNGFFYGVNLWSKMTFSAPPTNKGKE